MSEIPAGYKQTEVGVIPEGWDVKTLFELAEKKKELFDDGDWIESEHITNQGIRLIQTGNIGIGHFVEKDTKKYIYEKSFISLRCKELIEGDLLVCRLAEPAGRACVLPNIGEERVVTSVDVTIFRPPTDKLDRVFLANLFSTSKWFQAVSGRSGGTTHKRISRGALGRIPIEVPPLPEQRAIAAALSDVDALLNKLDQIIAKKRDLKQALMQQLLTGKTRLPGFSGAWEVKRLGELLAYEQPTKYLVSSSEYSDSNDVPVLTAGKTFVLGFTHETEGIFADLPAIIFDDFTTATKFVTFPFKAKSSAMKILKPRNPSVNLRLVFEIMQLIDFKLGDHKRYWISEYSKLEVKLPGVVEQTAIATFLSDVDAELAALEARRDKIRAIKQEMMHVLLTGRIRLI